MHGVFFKLGLKSCGFVLGKRKDTLIPDTDMNPMASICQLIHWTDVGMSHTTVGYSAGGSEKQNVTKQTASMG